MFSFNNLILFIDRKCNYSKLTHICYVDINNRVICLRYRCLLVARNMERALRNPTDLQLPSKSTARSHDFASLLPSDADSRKNTGAGKYSSQGSFQPVIELGLVLQADSTHQGSSIVPLGNINYSETSLYAIHYDKLRKEKFDL